MSRVPDCGIIPGKRVRLRAGQAALEYVLAFAGLLVVVAVLWQLVGASVRYADRTGRLVASECP